jgi:PHP family Zn ribbon phosphoesterase
VNLLSADLHIHTCLSPCAEPEMAPPMVVRRALEAELDLIAICDHNSAENVGSVRGAAEGTGLAVISGMEIASREEVHVVGLFQDDSCARLAQGVVYRHLSGKNDPEIFGEQLVMDARGKVLRHNPRLLIGATNLSLEEIVQAIHEAEGMAIAAHIDRPSFSLVSQLGFVPDGLGLDGMEVNAPAATKSVDLPALPEGLGVLASSDAHRLDQIGTRRTRLLIKQATYGELRMALKSAEGRRIIAESS